MSNSDSDPADASAEDSAVHADEDWKQEVKAENASFDETLKAEAQRTASAEPLKETEAAGDAASKAAENESSASEASAKPSAAAQMPPATFESLVSMFSTQAMVALGVIPNPATGKAEQFPDLARHFIDLLGVLETKTAGNLQQQEQTLLDTTLHHLRMAYVQGSSTTTSGDGGNEST